MPGEVRPRPTEPMVQTLQVGTQKFFMIFSLQPLKKFSKKVFFKSLVVSKMILFLCGKTWLIFSSSHMAKEAQSSFFFLYQFFIVIQKNLQYLLCFMLLIILICFGLNNTSLVKQDSCTAKQQKSNSENVSFHKEISLIRCRQHTEQIFLKVDKVWQ